MDNALRSELVKVGVKGSAIDILQDEEVRGQLTEHVATCFGAIAKRISHFLNITLILKKRLKVITFTGYCDCEYDFH